MRIVVPVLLGLLILLIGLATLRGLAGPRGGAALPERIELPPPNVRVLFWCENCGTELLLLRKGSETVPRHCGESMIRREEVLPEN